MSLTKKVTLIINILRLVIKYLPYIIELIKDINQLGDDKLLEAHEVLTALD